MATFSDLESQASVRTKINAAITKVDAADAIGNLTARKFDTVALLLAYAASPRLTVGTYIEAGGFRYLVVSSGEDVTTAGGDKLVVLPMGGQHLIDAFGAVASSSQTYASANIAAINAALLAGIRDGVPVVVPQSDAPYVINDHIYLDSDYNGLNLIGLGTLKFANVLNAANSISPWMIVLWDRVTPLENIKIEGLTLDGNRASVTLSGVTPATSFGIWVDQKTLLGDGVEINFVTASDFVTTGIHINQGPMVVRFCEAHDNGLHGIAFNNDPLGMLFGGFVHLIAPRTSDNEGYGQDFSGGKILCVDSVDAGSWYGNAKASVGLEHLIVRGAHWTNSPGNPADATSGRGFLTTGTAVDFTDSTLDMDQIYIEDAAAGSFTISAFGGNVKLGRIFVKNGDPAVINTEQGDINIAADKFTADRLESVGSTANGVVVTGACSSYTISHVESRRASRAGFACRATSGACNGIIRGGQMIENNQAGLATSAGAAVQHIVAGNIKIDGINIYDDQGAPTQVAGMYFTSAVQAEVDHCLFGTGIAAAGQVYSATAGTVVRFGRGNTGIVTRAAGTRVANGGGTNLGFSFPTAITGLGGLAYTASVVPGSADASGAHFINAVSNTALGITYASATPGGINNVTLYYDVEAFISR